MVNIPFSYQTPVKTNLYMGLRETIPRYYVSDEEGRGEVVEVLYNS